MSTPKTFTANRRDRSFSGTLTPLLYQNDVFSDHEGGALACPVCGGPYVHQDRTFQVYPGADEYAPETVTTTDRSGSVSDADADYYRALHGGSNRGSALVTDFWCENGSHRWHLVLRTHKGSVYPHLVKDSRTD